jgi:hypothetical protein
VPTAPVKPFLIAEEDDETFRLTIRQTRYNSQGYPWVVKRQLDDAFTSAASARAYATAEFGAKAGEFAKA